MLSIVKGSNESLLLTVVDRFKEFTSLEDDTVLPTYDVRAELADDTHWILEHQSAIASGLSLSCPVDTSLNGFVSGARYELYCEFTYATDPTTLRVRCGPFIFAVDHPPPPVGS